MRLWIDGSADGPTNMQRDRELLSSAEQGEMALRVYGWASPWRTVGRFQADVFNDGVPSVRRPTGGAAVLHGDDLTVAVAIPLERFGTSRLRNIHRQLQAPFQQALGIVGFAVEPGRAGGTDPDCFRTVTPCDLAQVGSGEKVLGLALRVTRLAVLAQASLRVRPVTGLQTVIPAAFAQNFAETIQLEPNRGRGAVDWLNALLQFEWDPIGVKHEPACFDEYAGYIGTILRSCPEESAVAEALQRISTADMKLRANPRRDLAVAKRIVTEVPPTMTASR